MRIAVTIPGVGARPLNVSASLLLQAREAVQAGAPRGRVGLVVLGCHVAPERVYRLLAERGIVGASVDVLDLLTASMNADPIGILTYAEAVGDAIMVPVRAVVEAPPVATEDRPKGPPNVLSPDRAREIIEAAQRGG